MKKFAVLTAILYLLSWVCFAQEEHFGKHVGELKDLSIKVVYTNYLGKTPQGLPIYKIGWPMSYELHINNNSPRTYRHFDIKVITEYHQSGTCNRYWHPYPLVATYAKGEPVPGDSTDTWNDVSIRGNEKIILSGGYTVPLETCSSLIQTHVIIKHRSKGKIEAGIMYENRECGVFFLRPPGRRRR